MKLVTIIRHAHAVVEAPGGADFRRRLDAQGKQEAREMARLAQASGLRPDRLLASPATRALATARLFAAALEIPARRIERVAAIYGADLETLTDLLRTLPASVSHALLVGHNPGVSRLVRWLAGADPDDYLPTAAVCTLRSDLGAWSELAPSTFERLSLLRPGDGGAQP